MHETKCVAVRRSVSADSLAWGSASLKACAPGYTGPCTVEEPRLTYGGILGYSLDDLMRHPEAQFRLGMTWANCGQWHINHIWPIAPFNHASAEDPEFRQCWALSNLQPLWASENCSKGAKWGEGSSSAHSNMAPQDRTYLTRRLPQS